MGQLTLRGVRKRYGEAEVIKGIDLEARGGEFLVFVGPSGCGKSTTLRLIAGFETISDGDVLIDGERANDKHPAERGCAMVFQCYALYPHMTVADNMGFALKMAGVPQRERAAQVARAAQTLRIDGIDALQTAKVALQHRRLSAGQPVGLLPDVAWTLGFDAQARSIA